MIRLNERPLRALRRSKAALPLSTHTQPFLIGKADPESGRAANAPLADIRAESGFDPLRRSGDHGILARMILEAAIAEDLKPLRKGGITFYPAAALERIFDWAQATCHQLEWVEGVFYRPETDEGQLSLSYMCERRDTEYDLFRATCLRLVADMEAEAVSMNMGGYFEIGLAD